MKKMSLTKKNVYKAWRSIALYDNESLCACNHNCNCNTVCGHFC
jgi:hypothetical protein